MGNNQSGQSRQSDERQRRQSEESDISEEVDFILRDRNDDLAADDELRSERRLNNLKNAFEKMKKKKQGCSTASINLINSLTRNIVGKVKAAKDTLDEDVSCGLPEVLDSPDNQEGVNRTEIYINRTRESTNNTVATVGLYMQKCRDFVNNVADECGLDAKEQNKLFLWIETVHVNFVDFKNKMQKQYLDLIYICAEILGKSFLVGALGGIVSGAVAGLGVLALNSSVFIAISGGALIVTTALLGEFIVPIILVAGAVGAIGVAAVYGFKQIKSYKEKCE